MEQPEEFFPEHIELTEPWHLKKDLGALVSIMVDISSELNLDELLSKIIHHAIDLCDADGGSIFLVDESNQVTKRYQYRTPDAMAKAVIPPGKGAFNEAIRTGQTVIVNDYRSYPDRIEAFVEAGVRSVLAAPIVRLGAVIGAMWVFNVTPEKRFLSYHARLLQTVSTQAAVAIEKALLYDQQLRSQREIAEALHASNVLLEAANVIGQSLDVDKIASTLAELVAEIVGVKRTIVFLYDPERKEQEVAAVHGNGLTHGTRYTEGELGYEFFATYRTRHDVLIESDDPALSPAARVTMGHLDMKRVLFVPVTVGERILGGIALDSPGSRVVFTSRGVKLVSALAKQAAAAIERAMLFARVVQSTQELQERGTDLETLLEVALDITAGLDLDELMRRITRNAAKITGADASAVGLVDERTGVITYRFIYNLPEIVTQIDIPPGHSLSSMVIEQEHPIIVEDYQDFPEALPILLEAGLRSLAIVPLWLRQRIIGTLWVSSKDPRKRFDERDLHILEGLGRHAAIAIENSRLYEIQRTISESLQRSMLPPSIPEIPGMDIGVKYNSATEEALVGGDFYDVFETKGKYALTIGDVSGKGIEAASSTSMIKYVLESYLHQNPSPAYALAASNEVVHKQIEQGVFITVFCGVYDPQSEALTFSNAGHPYPCLLNQINKTCTILTTHDPAVAIISDYKYQESTVAMHPGNIFVAYTDGVLETRAPNGEFFGEERLVNVLLEQIDAPAQNIADAILNACYEFSHGHLTDDIAILIVRRVV